METFVIAVLTFLMYLMFVSDRQNNTVGLLFSFRVADQNFAYALLMRDLGCLKVDTISRKTNTIVSWL